MSKRFRSILKNYKSVIIMLIFAFIIITGTFLLMLPVSSYKGTTFIDALFTSASATCVTGLSVYETGTAWTTFGQIVILCLIQIGGLGFMTIFTMVLMMLKKNIGYGGRMMISETLGIDSNNGLIRLSKHIFLGTMMFELIGAALLSIRMIPRFGISKGIYYSIFHSVSAFCNAGFDIIGDGGSLSSFNNDILVNMVIMSLIIIGGLGFLVWENILGVIKKKSRLSTHSKIVLVTTSALIIIGTVLFYTFECNNPNTIGNMKLWEQFLCSMFQSVTTRTAGFFTIPQDGMTDLSKFLTMILMFVGGAPASTAGGIKVVTLFVVFASVLATIKGNNETVVFKRRIDNNYVLKALSVITISTTAILTGTFIISQTSNLPIGDIIFETFSASGTVGLTLGITTGLNTIGKLVITVLMYFGRVGVMTVALSFWGRKKSEPKISYPEEKIIIG